MVHSLLTFLMVLTCSGGFIRNIGGAVESYDILGSTITTKCSTNDFDIFLFSRRLPNFAETNFQLNKTTCKACKGYQFNDTYIIFQTKATECGTITRTYNDSIIYTNIVKGFLEKHNDSLRNFTTILTAQCKIPNNVTRNTSKSFSHQNTSKVVNNTAFIRSELHSSVKPEVDSKVKPVRKLFTKSVVHPSLKPVSQEAVNVKVHTSLKQGLKKSAEAEVHPVLRALARRKKPPLESSVITFTAQGAQIVKIGDKVTFQVKLPTTQQERSFLAIHQCHASPDRNSENIEAVVSFIENGCETKPRLCDYNFEYGSWSQKFSFKVTNPIFEKAKSLYVHCRFVLCSQNDRKSLCATGCRGSKKEIKVKDNNIISLSAGPLAITQGQGVEMLLVFSLVAAALLTLVTVTLVFFYCKRRRRNPKRRDTLLDNEANALSHSDTSFHHDFPIAFEETRKTMEPPYTEHGCTILEEKKFLLNMDWTIV